ncbi:MAG: bifunctional phosphopantothenoylcysteine decarboxylase/phosphopantothenate--cysteine ligase CoaBC [Deltaproteobacteria bacterium]|nr:MAG: bifunctional phosphopantothenoylcysteine decarboxylase/phosphopantothenate--cysteine ligase CoaBC [Deltaproteobacteria bacterium]
MFSSIAGGSVNILLGVTGSISAYKTLDLARDLVKKGHQVKVILTKGAEKFVVPEVYRYLGATAVYSSGDDFQYPKNENDAPVLHVDLAKWADRFVLAPLSANTLSRLVHGEASDLLSSVFLAIPQDKPILVFPAMNTQMLNHPFVRENFDRLEKLKSLPQLLLHPTMSGELACGDHGEGKLAEVKTISEMTETYSAKNNGRSILLTAGATLSPLDSVRFLTNPSSGKTSYLLAKEALQKGYVVHVIAGKNATNDFEHLTHHPLFSIERVTTTEEMNRAVLSKVENYDNYITPAAISDIKFDLSEGKLKKEKMTEALAIRKDEDVLSNVLKIKKDKQKIVGFAAEAELTKEIMLDKYRRKPVDLLVGTLVNSGANGKEQKGFNVDQAEYMILKDGIEFESYNMEKNQLASFILERLEQ